MSKTLEAVIYFVDNIKPNGYDNDVKTQWINEIEGTVQTEILNIASADIVQYKYSENREHELIVDAPHDKLYWMYLCSMIDFANGEYSKYNNSMQMFNEAYSEYAKWFCRTHSRENTEVAGYCISAYGIAVKHGYTGTEEEWLATLSEASEAAARVANEAAGSANTAAMSANTAAASITGHTNNSTIHVTASDKAAWNAKQNALTSGSITESLIADGAVKSSKILDGAVKAHHIVNGAVISGRIASGAVATANIANGAVTAEKIASGAVTAEKIAVGATIGTKGTGINAEVFNGGSAGQAIGYCSHVEGDTSSASGYCSHAEGSGTEAYGGASHAEGELVRANGYASHAEGRDTLASGDGSHAEGFSTTASGFAAHSEGFATTANHKSQHVHGEYNIADDSTAEATERGNYVRIVGNGTDDAPSNAETLDWEGNHWVAGKATVGKLSGGEPTITPTAKNDLVHKGYVDRVIPTKTSQLTNDGEGGTGKYATQQFVEEAIHAGIREYDALVYKGFVAADFDLPWTDFKTGWTYKVVAEDTFFGQPCKVGDLIIANKDCSTYDSEVTYTFPSYVYYGGNYYHLIGNIVKGEIPDASLEWAPCTEGFWDMLQTSFEGAVSSGSDSTVEGNIAVFFDTYGRMISDSGISIANTVEDYQHAVPTSKAVFGYAQPKPSQVTTGTNIAINHNTEYRLTNVSTLTFTYPTGNFECYIRFTTAASGAVTITFPASSYIGSAPSFGNGETWEVSIKDGIIIAAKVGDGT